ncbi:hypothetical protein B296_00018891 [Ensete ventricosum]|uniref:Uncharacterized protein n=1 Tax=Ensete ventricosum TaxID=4639 RepID=A0A426YZK1_ENSVE|nr:hypothetical protein B296_00018891 [Ensete ventricosum]
MRFWIAVWMFVDLVTAQYMVFVFLLITLEAAITAFIFLNRDWEEALSIFMAMVLRALGPDSGTDCDSDDDSIPARLPLLRNQVFSKLIGRLTAACFRRILGT